MIIVDRVLDYDAIIYDNCDSAMESDLFLEFVFNEDDAYSLISSFQEDEGITLAFIILKDWEEKMVPWGSKVVKGEAKAKELSEDIPALLNAISLLCAGKIKRRFIIGYSLGGLFATWESFFGEFDGLASVSGSLWYPDIYEYASLQAFPKKLKKAYFSIGDKEGGKPSSPFYNAVMKSEAMATLFEERGVKTRFELNQGNHFADPLGRREKAIRWLLK